MPATPQTRPRSTALTERELVAQLPALASVVWLPAASENTWLAESELEAQLPAIAALAGPRL